MQNFLAICLALIGAFFLAIGTFKQSTAVTDNVKGGDLGFKGFLHLLTNSTWLLGWVLMITGTALNILALSLAPLTLVQPLGAIALVITTVINAKGKNHTLNKATITSIILCVVGSFTFVILAYQAVEDNHDVSSQSELLLVVIMVSITVFFCFLALFFKKQMNAFVYIVGAGVLFGFVAVLTRITALKIMGDSNDFMNHIPWLSVIGLAVTALLGLWFVQSAYSKGPPELVIAGLTVIDPIVGITIGITLLGELKENVNPLISVGMVLAGFVSILGVVLLSKHHPEVEKRREQQRQKLQSS